MQFAIEPFRTGKLECRNPASKVHLLKQARTKRPSGVFVSEFLTSAKRNIFYNLRQLKKQHPRKIRSAFTIGGNIFYRLQDSSQAVQVNSLDDLSRITLPENIEAVGGGN